MSIATAIQELINSKNTLDNVIQGINTTKGQIKSAVNYDIETIGNEQIEAYPELIRANQEALKQYIPKITGEGKQLSLNTVPLKPKEFAVKGDTFQQTYTGKNLLQISNVQDTWNDINVNITNGIITLNGTPSSNAINREIATFTATESGTYTLLPFKSATNSNIRLLYTINGGSQISDDNTPSFSLSVGDILVVKLRVSSTDSISNFQLKPMLYKGTETTDYEPYVGGQPSPNPSFPQNIQVVTGSQTIIKRGKNLLDLTNGIETGTAGGITCTKQSNGAYTFVGTSTLITINVWVLGAYALYRDFTTWEDFDKSKVLFDLPAGTYTVTDMCLYMVFEDDTKMGATMQLPTHSKTFTVTKTAHVIAARVPQCQADTEYDIVLYPQLEEGSTATTYEPYITPVELPLSLGDMEICKIGEYKDILFKNKQGSKYYNAELEENAWYEYNTVPKHIFNGADIDTYEYNTDLADVLAINLKPGKVNFIAIKKANVKSIYTNKFEYINNVTNEEHVYVTGGQQISGGFKGNIRLYISHSRLHGYDASLTSSEKIALLKSWLQENPLPIYYITVKPTYIKITDETLINQLEAIENTNMNNGTTIIYAENEEGLQPTLYMEAYAKAE